MEEFLQKQIELVDDDEKTLMIARINHELAEREALEQQRQGLLKKKQVLIAENKKRKDDLASLDQDLEKFIDVGGHTSGSFSMIYIKNVLTRYLLGGQTDTKDIRKAILGIRILILSHLYSGDTPIATYIFVSPWA